jgi:hypothetical protein
VHGGPGFEPHALWTPRSFGALVLGLSSRRFPLGLWTHSAPVTSLGRAPQRDRAEPSTEASQGGIGFRPCLWSGTSLERPLSESVIQAKEIIGLCVYPE